MFRKSEPKDGQIEPMSPSNGQSMPPNTRVRTQTTIGPSIEIRGEILVSGGEGVRIEGRVEGTISPTDGVITVGKDGQINATINARAIYVEGKVEGDLNGGDRVVIHSSGNVRGNIKAPRVTLEDGCKFNGSIDTDVEPRVTSQSTNASSSENIADIKLAAAGSGDAFSGGGLDKLADE